MQIPVNDRIIVWEKCEVLFLNIVSWSQVSSISFSGTKNALIFSFFLKKLFIISSPLLFFNFIYLIILAVQYGTWALSSSAAAAKSLQSCPTLCDPIDGSPPGSAIPGILQARTLEWVATSFSNA